MTTLRVMIFALVAASALWAQSATTVAPAANATGAAVGSTYILGPDDLIVIHALDGEEFSEKPVRIDMSGNIRLPLVGRVHAGGRTVEQLEAELFSSLKPYIKDPQVAVSVTEFRSQPISVIGEVMSEGVHQLQGKKTLVEIISLAGGVKDDAGSKIKITRKLEWGPIPLPGAKNDPSGQYSIAEVDVKNIVEARDPAENIRIYPEDVISVPRAEIVYVIGEVTKPGGYVLRERQSISVLQALSMAGGASKGAGIKNARILRLVADQDERQELPLDLKKIMSGTGPDAQLHAEDILFIPGNVQKNIALRTLEAAITIGTGLAIYRP